MTTSCTGRRNGGVGGIGCGIGVGGNRDDRQPLQAGNIVWDYGDVAVGRLVFSSGLSRGFTDAIVSTICAGAGLYFAGAGSGVDSLVASTVVRNLRSCLDRNSRSGRSCQPRQKIRNPKRLNPAHPMRLTHTRFASALLMAASAFIFAVSAYVLASVAVASASTAVAAAFAAAASAVRMTRRCVNWTA